MEGTIQMKFKKGMKVVMVKNIHLNYKIGKIFTLKKRESYSQGHYWNIEEHTIGVGEKEIQPLNWRDRYG